MTYLTERQRDVLHFISDRIEAEGVEAWFSLEASELLGSGASDYEKEHPDDPLGAMELFRSLEKEARYDAAVMVKEIKDEAQRTAEAEAVKITALAIERCASDFSAEVTAKLPDFGQIDVQLAADGGPAQQDLAGDVTAPGILSHPGAPRVQDLGALAQDLQVRDLRAGLAAHLGQGRAEQRLQAVDVARTDDPRHLAYQQANRAAGRHPGGQSRQGQGDDQQR